MNTTFSIVTARSPFLFGEAVDFFQDGARYRLSFDMTGVAHYQDSTDIPADATEAVRASDPEGRQYRIAEAAPYVPEKSTDEDEPPVTEPVTAPETPASTPETPATSETPADKTVGAKAKTATKK